MPDSPKRDAAPRRKPLSPLSDELAPEVREFVTALRRMHQELGYSLKALEGRLPASRSSLSRYLRGAGLPDERLLVEWCKQSFTGEDRLPELVELLHRANAAVEQESSVPPADGSAARADTGAAAPDGSASATGSRPAGTATAPGPLSGGKDTTGRPTGRSRRTRVALVAGAVTVVVAAGGTLYALMGPGSGSDDAPTGKTVPLTVDNADKDCQKSRSRECSLSLAKDPYRPYGPSNVGGRVWHGDSVHAYCRISDGTTITDEFGQHSNMWFQVKWKEQTMWMPGIRIDHEEAAKAPVPRCPD